tara:strand:- start:170 stop:448 length:279 start_codon:yes stop_codon:yes gene_type:complete
MTDYKHYYRLKSRLERAQKWERNFLETEHRISISDKVTQVLKKEAPITYFLTSLISLPIICLTFLKKRLVYQSYRKCKKEIELIQEEIKHYE